MKKKISILILALGSLGIAKAQCVAYYTATPNPLNNGNVSFQDTATALAGPSSILSWSFGDGTGGYGNPVTHNYSASGTYYACLTVTDSMTMVTCTYCDSVHVIDTVSVAPTCTAYFVHSDSLGYVYFQNLSSGVGLTYTWNFGDGTTGSTPNPIHVYTPGVYTACLTVTNASGTCTNTYCDSITINSCAANMYYTIDTSGTNVSFFAYLMGTADTYSWNFGDGGTSTLANPVHNYTTPGTYNACLTVTSSTDATCGYTVCQNVTISNGCSANFVIVQDSLNLYNYTIYSYGAGVGGSTTSYLWDFGDSTTSTLQYPSHTYSWSGPFYICLTVTSSSMLGTLCTANHCDSIYPGHNPSNVVTINVVNGISMGVQERVSTEQSLNNYPNPFENKTTISYTLAANSPVELYVMDILGNKIATIESGNKASGKHLVEFDATDLASGIYMLQLKTNTKTSTTKFIITR